MARDDTLFALLLRQPWWVTLLVAFVLFAVASSIFPPVAPFVALPFVGLAGYIGYRHWRSGGTVDAGERLRELREMPWEQFSALVTDAYRRQGYTVADGDGHGHDYKLTRDGRLTLVQCRRWKVNQVGVGPLRELARAVEREGASRGICIAAGNFSQPALQFVAAEPISLLTGEELASFLRRRKGAKAAR